MAKKSNIIELNGKRYDALSGRLLGDSEAAAPPPVQPSVRRSASAPSAGRSMDGLIASRTHAAPKPVAQPATQPQPVTADQPVRVISDMVRTPARHAAHHKPATSRTLMRRAVHKPAPSLKRHTTAQTRTDVLVKQPSITVTPKLSSYQLDPRRVQHAQTTPKHQDVSRYAIDRRSLAPGATEPTPAKPPVAAAAVQPVHAAVAADALRRPAAPQAHSMDIFERALAQANSHTEKPLTHREKRRRGAGFGRRALSIGAASLAVLLLVGFFAWQQKANLTMRYAAAKAGVAATLPAYKPAGFTAGKFTYSPGMVAVNFDNARTGDNFALVEKSSSWDSDALRDSFVASRSRTFQTIDAAGRTIYTYGNNNATWVNGGIWYQVNSGGSLTTNQLVDLAASM